MRFVASMVVGAAALALAVVAVDATDSGAARKRPKLIKVPYQERD